MTYPWIEGCKTLIGELARPFAIISTSLSASIATVVIAFKVDSFEGGATFIGAVFFGVGVLYGAKAFEVAYGGRQAAKVEVAKATGSAPSGAPTPDGELPPAERLA